MYFLNEKSENILMKLMRILDLIKNISIAALPTTSNSNLYLIIIDKNHTQVTSYAHKKINKFWQAIKEERNYEHTYSGI